MTERGLQHKAAFEYEPQRRGRAGVRNERGLFVGRYPDGSTLGPEAHLIDQLARQVGGLVEVGCGGYRADVATPVAIFEVEPVTGWRRGFAQAARYSWITGLAPALALFGNARANWILERYLYLRDQTQSRMTLWVHNYGRWHVVRSREGCRDISFSGASVADWEIRVGRAIPEIS